MQNETDGVDLAELSQQGYASLKEGQFDEAGHQFQAVLDQDPENSYALVGMGDLNRKQRAWRQAVDYYKRCLASDTENNYALFGLAESYRAMHGAGYCYRDISEANFCMDLKTAEIRIFDNDNCMVDKVHVGNIEGTGGFMAPEVQRGEALPSTVTDQHSLAVLLFMLWHWHHPLHGCKESAIRVYDLPAQDFLYGHEPVFIFDPHDRSNELPNEEGYRAVPAHWNVLPTFVRRLFTRAFTKGLHEPAERVTDLEWIHAFSKLQDLRYICPDCHAENFYDPEDPAQQYCWNNSCHLQFPPKLMVKNNPENTLLAMPGQKLTTSLLGRKSSVRIIGEIETYSGDQELCLLRNKTAEPWIASVGDDSIRIPKDKGVVLYPGIHVQIENTDLIVQS